MSTSSRIHNTAEVRSIFGISSEKGLPAGVRRGIGVSPNENLPRLYYWSHGVPSQAELVVFGIADGGTPVDCGELQNDEEQRETTGNGGDHLELA